MDVNQVGFMQSHNGSLKHVARQEIADGGRSFEKVAYVADGADGEGAAAGITDTEDRLAKHEEGFENGWGGDDEVL